MSIILAPEWDCEIADRRLPAGSPDDVNALATIRTVFDLALIDHLEAMGLPIPADLFEDPQ